MSAEDNDNPIDPIVEPKAIPEGYELKTHPQGTVNGFELVKLGKSSGIVWQEKAKGEEPNQATLTTLEKNWLQRHYRRDKTQVIRTTGRRPGETQ